MQHSEAPEPAVQQLVEGESLRTEHDPIDRQSREETLATVREQIRQSGTEDQRKAFVRYMQKQGIVIPPDEMGLPANKRVWIRGEDLAVATAEIDRILTENYESNLREKQAAAGIERRTDPRRNGEAPSGAATGSSEAPEPSGVGDGGSPGSAPRDSAGETGSGEGVGGDAGRVSTPEVVATPEYLAAKAAVKAVLLRIQGTSDVPGLIKLIEENNAKLEFRGEIKNGTPVTYEKAGKLIKGKFRGVDVKGQPIVAVKEKAGKSAIDQVIVGITPAELTIEGGEEFRAEAESLAAKLEQAQLDLAQAEEPRAATPRRIV
jgi:hypothetical protein